MLNKDISLFYWKPRSYFHFWRPDRFLNYNFGDYISLIITNEILAQKGLVLSKKRKSSRRILAIGSILHLAKNNDVVWGSGINGNCIDDLTYPKRLDVRAVRGPLTRDFLINKGIDAPEIYGDPALLLPQFYPMQETEKKNNYFIISHFKDIAFFKHSPYFISAMSDWKLVINKIWQSRLIISTSLHGIICAEAYGIPAVYLRVSEHEHLFKYKDYYAGTGRTEFAYASSIDEALQIGGQAPPIINLKKLLDAFPYDLWE